MSRGVLLLAALGACADPPAGPTASSQLHLTLDHVWTPDALEAAGTLPGSLAGTHPLVLPAGWRQGDHAVLRGRGYGWRVHALVDGVEAGSDVGGLRPITIDLSAALHAGRQDLRLVVDAPTRETVWPGVVPRSVLLYTYAQPRPGRALVGEELWLELAPGAHVDDLQVRTEGDTVEATATVAGAEGQVVTFEVVRDGRVLARLPEAVVTDGVARSRGPWRGTRWRIGGGEEPALQYLVARLPGGGARQVRFGAREVVRDGRTLRLDGEATYLTAQRVSVATEPRAQLAALVETWRSIGYNAVELHGIPVTARFLDAADELGLPVVRTPACDGRRREEGDESPTAPWLRYATEFGRRVVADESPHPSVVVWSVEAHPIPSAPAVYEAYHTAAVPGLDLDEASGYNADNLAKRVPGRPLAPFIVELAFQLSPSPAGTAATMAALLREHARDGMGAVLPDVLPADLAKATAAERTYLDGVHDTLVASTRPALRSGTRRGIATLEVHARRAGASLVGEIFVLDAPGHPSLGTLVGADGVATFELDYAGPATVRRLGDARTWPVELEPGHYARGRWVPGVRTVSIELPTP